MICIYNISYHIITIIIVYDMVYDIYMVMI